MSTEYIVGNSDIAKKRYELSKKLESEGLKPFLNPPFVNLPDIEVTENYKQNILIDGKTISSIKYVSLKKSKSIGPCGHKENFHYILLMKGTLAYYEKPIVNAKGVYLNRINMGQMFYVPPMSEYEIIAEENDSQFYIFSHKSSEESKLDALIMTYDIKTFPIISRPETGPVEYIKRFSYENT